MSTRGSEETSEDPHTLPWSSENVHSQDMIEQMARTIDNQIMTIFQRWLERGKVRDFDEFQRHVSNPMHGLDPSTLQDVPSIMYARDLALVRDAVTRRKALSSQTGTDDRSAMSSVPTDSEYVEEDEEVGAPEVLDRNAPSDDPIDALEDHVHRILRLLQRTPVLSLGLVPSDTAFMSTPVVPTEGQKFLVNAVLAPLMRLAGLTQVVVQPTETNYRTNETKLVEPDDHEGRRAWVRQGISGCLILPDPE